MAAPSVDMTCDDISAFQETLRMMRKIDDNIVHALNTTIPTASFAEKASVTNQCEDLYKQLIHSYERREQAIKKCIDVTAKEVQTLKDKRSSDPDNFELLKQLRKVQTKTETLSEFEMSVNESGSSESSVNDFDTSIKNVKFRLMQNELNIEEVVKDRSLKVFYERCRFYYKPAELKI